MKTDDELSKLPELQKKLKDEYFGQIWDNIENGKRYVMIDAETSELYSVRIIDLSANKQFVNCVLEIYPIVYKWYTYLQFMNDLLDEIPAGAK